MAGDSWEKKIAITTLLFDILLFLATATYVYVSTRQLHSMKRTLKQVRRQTDITERGFVYSQRPWVKITHRIVQPLTFDQPAWQGPVARMEVEGTLENVGPTVALDVLAWAEIIPIDSDFSWRSAITRQKQWCDANRHPDPHGLSGVMLFPHDPFPLREVLGQKMEVVNRAARASPKGLEGKVAFVMVGCVSYRVPFEQKRAQRHETKFVYELGKLSPDGALNPWVEPTGAHSELQLVNGLEGFSAD
jgi:hypothetical protein